MGTTAIATSNSFGGNHTSEKTWERNTAGLIAHAHQNKEQKHKRVDEAITCLL